tara:strand:+ start:366 stop:737 length:372 start_codon:yes stop_codon:yes gene_type:complete
MASELRVNTLKDASGNNSVGMSYVANGSAKMIHVFNGEGTVSTSDSFNVSSLTDVGTGDYTTTFSSAFSSVNFSNSANNNYYGYGETQAKTTTTVRNRVRGNSTYSTLTDTSVIDLSNHGDLA